MRSIYLDMSSQVVSYKDDSVYLKYILNDAPSQVYYIDSHTPDKITFTSFDRFTCLTDYIFFYTVA